MAENQKTPSPPQDSVKKKNFLGSFLTWKKHGDFAEPDLNRVWLFILIGFAVVGCVILSLHFVLYVRIQKSEAFLPEASQVPRVETIDRTHLRDTLEFLREKERSYEALRESLP